MVYIWITVGLCLLAALFFFCKIRIKLLYQSENNTVLVKIWFVTVYTYPAAQKKPSPDKKPLLSIDPEMEIKQLFALISDLFAELGVCLKKIVFEYFSLELAVGTPDAAETGKLCGYAWAAYGAFWPRVKSMASIKKENISIYCDFNAPRTVCELAAVLSVTPFGVCVIAARLAKFLKRLPQFSEAKVDQV